MSPRRAFAYWPQAVTVSPILDTISSSVSAMPAAPFVAQPASVQRGPGGFALTLAAAQVLTTRPSEKTGKVAGAAGSTAGSTAATANLNVRTAQNPQLKRSLNNGQSATPSAVVSGFVATAENPLAGSQPSLPPSLTVGALLQQAGIATESVQAASLAAIPNEMNGQTNGQGVSIANSAQPAALSNSAVLPGSNDSLPNSAAGSQWNGSQNGLGSAEPTLLAGNAQPIALSPTIGQPTSDFVLPNATADSRGNASLTNGFGLGTAVSGSQANQAAESKAPAPTLSANATPNHGATSEMILTSSANPQIGSSANPQIGQTNAASAVAPVTVTVTAIQTDLSAGVGTGNPFSGITNGQISGSSALIPVAQLSPGTESLLFAVPRTSAVVIPNVVGGGQGAGAPSSIPASASPTGPDSGKGSQIANQTPFSVFFSGPGPGTEAAASALPKMILPATSSAIRGSHISSFEGPTANSKTGGLQSGGSQDAAAQNTKASAAGTGGGSSQTAQPLHRDGDPSVALQFASLQPAAPPAAALPASAGVTPPSGGQTAPAADSLPKPDTLPGAASGSPASLVPAASQPATIAGPVQMAQLINRIGQSEMRIGINTSAFGSVEVRTVVHANDVGLVIGSEKGDLRTLLANELPAITNTLQQQNLRLNSVNFMQGFAFSNNASGGGESQQHSFVPMRAAVNSTIREAAVDDSIERLPAVELGGGRSNLSILA